MLALSTLHALLAQILAPPDLHTAALFTPAGQLVAFAAAPPRPKDLVYVLGGLADQLPPTGGTLDSPIGRILVLPVADPPLMLLALNARDDVPWDRLHAKGRALARHLAHSLDPFRAHLAPPPPPPALASPELPTR